MDETFFFFFTSSSFSLFCLITYLLEMGFGPLEFSCSLALKILSCHANGDLQAWYLPFLLPGEGTWIALVEVDSLLHVELVLDLPTLSVLEVNSMLFLFMDPYLEATSGENLRFLSAMMVL